MAGKSVSNEGSELLKFGSMLATSTTELKDTMAGKFDQLEEILTQHDIWAHDIHLYTWVERNTVRVNCLAQEHKRMSRPRARTRPLVPEKSPLTIRLRKEQKLEELKDSEEINVTRDGSRLSQDPVGRFGYVCDWKNPIKPNYLTLNSRHKLITDPRNAQWPRLLKQVLIVWRKSEKPRIRYFLNSQRCC